MKPVHVDLAERSYDIAIAPGLRAEFNPPDNAILITDSNVERVWGGFIADKFSSVPRVAFPAGEMSKHAETVVDICRNAARNRLDRSAVFIALGGGVVGDLAGFAAAIYMRGVKFVQMPTTLLAMVDSSIGGKTGADIPEGKNLIGAFHQPQGVFIDPEFLRTLPVRELRCGLAELIKTAVLFDAKLFDELAGHAAEILQNPAPARCAAFIRRACELKAVVVAADEREGGLRALLNYGHTFGHALEIYSDFAIGHGEAVAIGMSCAARLAVSLGICSAGTLERQEALLRSCDLPTRVPRGFAPERIVELMRGDKKNLGGAIRVVLPSAIGRAELRGDIADGDLLAAVAGNMEA